MVVKEIQSEAAQRLYDNRAPTYDASYHKIFVHDFLGLADIQAGQRVLDLACGTGLVTFLAGEKVGPKGQGIGIDVSTGMLGVAKARQEKDVTSWLHLTFKQHDIMDLDHPDLELEEGTFDYITCASALVLLQDPLKALKHWARYLKPGGSIIVDVTNPRLMLPSLALEAVGKRLGQQLPYYRLWVTSEAAFGWKLMEAGFIVEKMQFVQETGGRTRTLNVKDWEEQFEETMNGPHAKVLADADEETRQKARQLFKEEWEKLADEAGNVQEVDGVFVAVGCKPGPDTFDEDVDRKKLAVFTGGCRCGKVSYQCRAQPKAMCYCHCRACQQMSGSGNMTFVDIPFSAVRFVKDSSLKTIALSDFARRTLCGDCGSPISMRYWQTRDMIGLTAASMDDISRVDFAAANKHHIFLKEKAPWETLPEDGLRRYDMFSDAAFQ